MIQQKYLREFFLGGLPTVASLALLGGINECCLPVICKLLSFVFPFNKLKPHVEFV